MYVAPSSVNACYAFDIDTISNMVFAINRCIRVPKINFGQSVLKIPAKNYVGLINFGPSCVLFEFFAQIRYLSKSYWRK